MADIAQGVVVSSAEAKVVCLAAGIGRYDAVPVSGLTVEVAGRLYTILQLETTWPGPTSTSPDGTHVVYKLSQEETDARKNPNQTWWDTARPYVIAVLVLVAVYLAVRFYGDFKRV